MNFGFLSTIDDEVPRVRPIAVRYFANRLLFSTFSTSEKVSQIKANNNVEISWLFNDMSHVRITAKANIISDKNLKKDYLDKNSSLKEYFKDENDRNYTLFELHPEKVAFNRSGAMEYDNIKW